VTLDDRWELGDESGRANAPGDDDPFAVRLPTLLLANKVECFADVDTELQAFLEVTGLHYPAVGVSAATGQGLGQIGVWLFTHLGLARKGAGPAAGPGPAIHPPSRTVTWSSCIRDR